MKKYKVMSSFYDFTLNRSFAKGKIMELEECDRVRELIKYGCIELVKETKKKSTKEKGDK